MDSDLEEVPESVRIAYLSGQPQTVSVSLRHRIFCIRVIPSDLPVEVLWREFVAYLKAEHLI